MPGGELLIELPGAKHKISDKLREAGKLHSCATTNLKPPRSMFTPWVVTASPDRRPRTPVALAEMICMGKATWPSTCLGTGTRKKVSSNGTARLRSTLHPIVAAASSTAATASVTTSARCPAQDQLALAWCCSRCCSSCPCCSLLAMVTLVLL